MCDYGLAGHRYVGLMAVFISPFVSKTKPGIDWTAVVKGEGHSTTQINWLIVADAGCVWFVFGDVFCFFLAQGQNSV